MSNKAKFIALTLLCIAALVLFPVASIPKRKFHSNSLPEPKNWTEKPIVSLSKTKEPKIVVSLSTFAGRAERLATTLKSLSQQTMQFDRLYIHMPKAVARLKGVETDTVPKVLQDWQNTLADKLIITHPEDFGPATKLLPTLLLEQDPNTIIVVLDDDVAYNPRTIQSLVETLQSNTKQFTQVGHPAAFCCEEWSRFIPFPLIRYNTRSPGSICSGYMCAYASEAFMRWHFNNETVKAMFDYNQAPAGCKLHDDVWISGILRVYANLKPMMVQDTVWSVDEHRKWDDLTIHKVPGTEKKYRNPCLEHFGWFTM
jgi:hypothetical protein